MTNQFQPVKVSDIMSDAARIGIIGSPSSTTEVCLEIMGHSVNRKLVGELVLFNYMQDETPHYALGQINEVRMSNILHESPPIRSLARQRGAVDHVSARQDTHQGKMTVSAVFSESAASGRGHEPSILGTVPATGTPVCVADDPILDALLHPYRDQLFYLGNVYGSKPKMPMWFKHFGTGAAGLGEAYHLGIFGMTGAGKSTLAKMVMLAYAKHPEMAILVLDPKGEFSKDARNAGENQWPIRYKKMEGNVSVWPFNKPVWPLSVRDLVLDRWDLFSEILEVYGFFQRLTVASEKNRKAARGVLIERLSGMKVTLEQLHERESFDKAWKLLGDPEVQKLIYAGKVERDRFADTLKKADRADFYQKRWKPAAHLFNARRQGARKVDHMLFDMLGKQPRPMVLLDLSNKDGAAPSGLLAESPGDATDATFWNKEIQPRVIKRLLEGLTRVAEKEYQKGGSLNTLVVIDEARRLAPRELSGQDDMETDVRKKLIDAVQTTRAYGLGWMFISPTLHGLNTEIIQALRVKFFGFGLGMGSEFNMLRDMAGSSGPALDLYRTFSDPHSAPDAASRQYSFMTVGPVSPLSFSGSPLFFNAFNSRGEFIAANFPENNRGKDDEGKK